MNAWYLFCFLSALAVLICFANQYVLHLQTTVAITTGSVLLSLLLILGVSSLGDSWAMTITHILGEINFNQLLLNGMLGFLLYAGALEIDLMALRKQRWEITILVLFSTLASTIIVGYLSYWLLGAMGWQIPLIYCMLFGALISPTDPIAVLAIIKQMKAPEGISVQVEGESLFNDGVGLVIFSTLYSVAFFGTEPTFTSVAELFLKESMGGILFGLVLAGIGHWLVLHCKDVNLRLLVTLTIPTAGFASANLMHVSGALAMVTAGIILGNVTRPAASAKTGVDDTLFIKHFWHATDTVLNALLFLLIGLILVNMPLSGSLLMAGALMVPLVLFSRFISVGAPYLIFKRYRSYDKNSVRILTWGGLRGGLALAMAASVPQNTVVINGVDLHNLIVLITYIVVIFSIIVQGTTISPLIRKSIEHSQTR